MNKEDMAARMMDRMKKRGAEKSQVWISSTETRQLSMENGNINQLYSVEGGDVNVRAITGQKLGVASINKWDESSVFSVCDRALEAADASLADAAYDIAPCSENKSFKRGASSPDMDKMYFRFQEILSEASRKYPDLKIEKGKIAYNINNLLHANSNGVRLDSEVSNYLAQFTFLARKNQKVSSFNYSYAMLDNLDAPLLQNDAISLKMEQAVKQLEARRLGDKFTGDVIITPFCLMSFIDFLTSIFLSDQFIIAKRGFLADKLDNSIAGSSFSLRAMPVDPIMADPKFFTADGFKSENSVLIDKGVLKSFNLSLYGANKTGFDRFAGGGGNYMVDAGEIALADQIKNVKKGILLTRYSGSRPNDQGDFSGVAKNSYYIENGEIKYPVMETMVSGNLADLLLNIQSVSKKRINFGFGVLPWIHAKGVTVSGK
ncbi:MAG: metallopeptidase TldD-related protein [Halobacteriovoraceae bacterium]|nr:metallopeptidase TldD-related protein [Halobacteriovoraceae bacterium]